MTTATVTASKTAVKTAQVVPVINWCYTKLENQVSYPGDPVYQTDVDLLKICPSVIRVGLASML